MPGKLRLFVALDPGPGVQGKMAEIQARLARSGAARHVRWVAPENLHLTLKFLGETPEDKIPQIEEVLRRVASQHSSLELELAGVGAFPNVRRPRVLWIGVREGHERLVRLARHLERELEPLGYQAEHRGFTGHFTLGRIKNPTLDPVLEHQLSIHAEIRVGHPTIREILLMKSELRKGGAVYSCIGRFPLTGEPPLPR